VDLLAVAGGAAALAVGGLLPAAEAAAEGEGGGLAINFFWIIVSSLNFLLFMAILYVFALRPVSRMLDERRAKIEQGLRDAEQARKDREASSAERLAALNEARRESNEILARAQKLAQETRDADIAATREELDRMRERASAEIEAEKQRALADLRSEVADLALMAASKVIGNSMTDDRQRRLIQEFLAETGAPESRS
jgi:F-type H+-transporting ATPase subunit b